jgi:hypothetical protein
MVAKPGHFWEAEEVLNAHCQPTQSKMGKTFQFCECKGHFNLISFNIASSFAPSSKI